MARFGIDVSFLGVLAFFLVLNHTGSKNWVQHKHCRTGTWKIWPGHCWLGDHFPFEKAALFFQAVLDSGRAIESYQRT